MTDAKLDLATVHLTLCELLESPVISASTREQVRVLKETVEKELEHLKSPDYAKEAEA